MGVGGTARGEVPGDFQAVEADVADDRAETREVEEQHRQEGPGRRPPRDGAHRPRGLVQADVQDREAAEPGLRFGGKRGGLAAALARPEGGLELGLHAALPRLAGPPAERRPVVGHVQPETDEPAGSG